MDIAIFLPGFCRVHNIIYLTEITQEPEIINSEKTNEPSGSLGRNLFQSFNDVAEEIDSVYSGKITIYDSYNFTFRFLYESLMTYNNLADANGSQEDDIECNTFIFSFFFSYVTFYS